MLGNVRKEEREGKVEPSEARGKKCITNPVCNIPHSRWAKYAQNMTATQHGMVQKRSSQNVKAAESQEQPLLGRAKLVLALGHKWGVELYQVRREGSIWAEEVAYAKTNSMQINISSVLEM